jgi:hypothetical protein
MKKSELLDEVRHKRIEFETDGKPNGKTLDIDYRVKAMPYGKKRRLMENALNIQGSVKRLQAVGKALENKSLSEVEQERFEEERKTIMQQISGFNEPLVEYLAGNERRLPALVNWDLLADDESVIPINREEIEDLDEETISFIAWQLLSGTDSGEATGTRLEQSSPSEPSGVPA